MTSALYMHLGIVGRVKITTNFYGQRHLYDYIFFLVILQARKQPHRHGLFGHMAHTSNLPIVPKTSVARKWLNNISLAI